MPNNSQRVSANSDLAHTYQNRCTNADSNGLNHSDRSGRPDAAYKRIHEISDNCSCGGRDKPKDRSEATKDSGKAKSADTPFHTDEDLELSVPPRSIPLLHLFANSL